VAAVTIGSPADRVGLPLQSVIVAVDDQRVRDPHGLARLIAAAGEGAQVRLTYYTADGRHEARVQLDANPPAEGVDVRRKPAAPGAPSRLPGQGPSNDGAKDRQIEALERQVEALTRRVELLEKQRRAAN
jgi:hypothetical protein